MNWRTHKKSLILHYRPFSCGKFLANCLSYNANFLAQIPDQDKIDNYTDVDIKHQYIMSTIPEKDQLKKWRSYELGCLKFYNFYLNEGSLTEKIQKLNPKVRKLIETEKYYTFIISHDATSLEVGKSIFPNSKIIQLINDDKAHDLSQQLKNTYPFRYGHSYPQLKVEKGQSVFHFDIDSMFEKNSFFKNVDLLMDWLQIEDKTLDTRVNLYYDRYQDLYK
jgi:hypothetical protein